MQSFSQWLQMSEQSNPLVTRDAVINMVDELRRKGSIELAIEDAEDFLERRGIRQMSHSDDNILFQAIENGFKVDKYLK